MLGPADDGGYYLLGMTAPHAALFRDVDWEHCARRRADRRARRRARARSGRAAELVRRR
ncbi:MAG: DUF2064 domain-containing protein [Pseudomonadota bacterium]